MPTSGLAPAASVGLSLRHAASARIGVRGTWHACGELHCIVMHAALLGRSVVVTLPTSLTHWSLMHPHPRPFQASNKFDNRVELLETWSGATAGMGASITPGSVQRKAWVSHNSLARPINSNSIRWSRWPSATCMAGRDTLLLFCWLMGWACWFPATARLLPCQFAMCAADDPNFVRLDMWLGQDKDKFMIPKKKTISNFHDIIIIT